MSAGPASFVRLLADRRVVAVVRHADRDVAADICRAVIAGGLRAVEVTCTVPGAAALIGDLRASAADDVLVGAGTVLTSDQLEDVVAAGAQFVVSPGLDPDIVARCVAARVPVVPGVLTPSEAMAGQALGLDVLKLFPASTVGPGHLRALRAVLANLAFMPTGGVTSDNAHDWFAAGAAVVGLSGDIEAAHRAGGAEAVRRLARHLAESLEQGSGSRSATGTT